MDKSYVTADERAYLNKPKKRNKRKEILTDKDIKDLMGVNRDRYKRSKGGAFRRS